MATADPQPLLFISGDPRCQAAQEAIRVHVMRRQHRQRKQRQRSKRQEVANHGSDASFSIWVPTQTTPPSKPASYAQVSAAAEHSPSVSYIGVADQDTSSPDELFASAEFQNLAAAIGNSGSATDQPDDDSPESVLVRYYHQYGGGSTVSHEFYRAYCETTTTYSAFLAMIATNYSKEKGEPPPMDPEELENFALRDVADQLSRSPTAPPSNTMLAVALLANLRVFRNEHDLVQCHWDALRRMIFINGGIQRFRMHQSLYSFFFWIEAVVLRSVRTSIGQINDDEHGEEDAQSEMVGFLKKINKAISQSLRVRNDACHKLTPPITETLSTSPCKPEPYSVNKWRNARLACLIFLAAISLQCNGPLEDNVTYRAVVAEIQDRQQRYTMYPDELYYVLVLICNQDELCSLTWSVARLTTAVKRLEGRDKHTCHRLLCTYFGFADPFASDMVSEDWTELSDRLEAK